MKTAIAYITKSLKCPSRGEIGQEIQEERIRRYAEVNGIRIIRWVSDEECVSAPFARPGVAEMMAAGGCDLVLIESVRAFSPYLGVLKRLYSELVRRGMRVVAVETLWDVPSQMTRHIFEPELNRSRAIRSEMRAPIAKPEMRRAARIAPAPVYAH